MNQRDSQAADAFALLLFTFVIGGITFIVTRGTVHVVRVLIETGSAVLIAALVIWAALVAAAVAVGTEETIVVALVATLLVPLIATIEEARVQFGRPRDADDDYLSSYTGDWWSES